MAAKPDGGAYLTSFVDAVLDKLSSILEDDSVLDSALELLGRLEKSLYEVGPVLDDAEQKQFTDKRVKKWLVDLQDTLYMADDLLDELSTEAAMAATQRDPGEREAFFQKAFQQQGRAAIMDTVQEIQERHDSLIIALENLIS